MPDFTLRRDGRTAHLEIVGFWRKAWLERRIDGIARVPNLVLAVSRKLQTDRGPLAALDRVVPFAEVIPVKRVLEVAERVAT